MNPRLESGDIPKEAREGDCSLSYRKHTIYYKSEVILVGKRL
jgi:hypothetical protein